MDEEMKGETEGQKKAAINLTVRGGEAQQSPAR